MNSSVIQPSSRDGSAQARMTRSKQVSTRTSYRLTLCRIDRVTRSRVERQDAAGVRRPPAEHARQAGHFHRKNAAAIGAHDRRRLEIAADTDQIVVRQFRRRRKTPAALPDRLRCRLPSPSSTSPIAERTAVTMPLTSSAWRFDLKIWDMSSDEARPAAPSRSAPRRKPRNRRSTASSY